VRAKLFAFGSLGMPPQGRPKLRFNIQSGQTSFDSELLSSVKVGTNSVSLGVVGDQSDRQIMNCGGDGRCDFR
jgi:hypothetical protein